MEVRLEMLKARIWEMPFSKGMDKGSMLEALPRETKRRSGWEGERKRVRETWSVLVMLVIISRRLDTEAVEGS